MTTTAEATRIEALPLPAATVWTPHRHHAGHQVPTSAAADNGYDWLDQMRSLGWLPLSSWGQDGWDLGEWPYNATAVYTPRDGDGKPLGFAVANRIEGDLEVRVFESFQARCDHIDRIAYDHWSVHQPEVIEGGYTDVHRGPWNSDDRSVWEPPRHVMPDFGVPFGEHSFTDGKDHVTCPVCFKVISEDDATGPHRDQLLRDEAGDVDGLGSKTASLAYAQHFQNESEAGR